jgi:hypothetical protein
MKNTLYVRGDDSREEFVKANEVIPIFRRILGKGEILKCACHNPVEKEIFFFEVIHKKTGKKNQLFTGSDCGRKILKLAEKEKPPLFSLFKSELKVTEIEKAKTEEVSREHNLIQFCPLNQELYNAIGILCEAWGIKFPDGPLLDMLLFLIKVPHYPTKDWAITNFNTMVGKDREKDKKKEKRTLIEMLVYLQEDGKQLKDFQFPLMNAVIDKSGETNNIQ